MTWNWQQADWPHFRFSKSRLEPLEARFLHSAGILFGILKHMDPSAKEQLRIELLTLEAIQTSAIEGEILDRDSVQSSLRRQFGLHSDHRRIAPSEQGIAEMMVDLYRTFDQPLTHEMLWRWHTMLTKGRKDLTDIGRYRTHEEPMQVVSGQPGQFKVHFEAPPSSAVPKEMERFIQWFNTSALGGDVSYSALTRAGLAHLDFVTIHPFEDGNGRIGRAIAEKALAQNLSRPTLLALADTIKRRQKEYYFQLEAANKDNEVTSWLEWFADIAIEAESATQIRIEFVLRKTKLLDKLRDNLNSRQEKVLLRMFKEGPEGFKGGMSAEKYIKLTSASRATATRDLQDLVDKGALRRTGELKHTRYSLAL